MKHPHRPRSNAPRNAPRKAPGHAAGVLVALAAASGSALAQFGETYAPPDVRAPVLPVWAFERPLVPIVVLVLIGLASVYAAGRAGRPRQGGLALAGCVLVAAGLVVSSVLVTTPRERAATTCRAFIEAVATNDTDAAAGLLRPTVSLRMAFGASAESRESILAQVRRLHAETTVRSARVLDTRVDLRSPTLARVYVRVKVEGNVSGVPIPPYSWWQLDLATQGEAGDAWELAAIEPKWIVGIDNPAGR